MKSICRVSIVLFIVCSFLAVNAQEQKATSVKPEENVDQKAQNNNTVRSNRTESKATIDQSTQNDNSGAANAKKGYDYYQAKSDMNSTKSQDHNSSRSNKTSQKDEKDDESGTENKAFNQNSSRSNNPQPKK